MSHTPPPTVEVHRISPHVSAIELPLPLEGLTSVNCYVIQGAAGTALVDPGWSTPATTGTLEGAYPRQVALLREAGAIDREIAALPADLHEQAMDFEPPDGWIDDGDELDLGGITVRSLATPGHTRGHVCFEVVEEQLLLTGDHVLPRITPSIAYEREPDRHSLISYLGSLRLVADLPAHRMLPAHGAIEGSAAARASELVRHHDERLAVIVDLLRTGRSTAFEVASAMEWTRRGRPLTELEPTHRMVAVLEAAAHLIALEGQGTVALEHQDGVEHYAVA